MGLDEVSEKVVFKTLSRWWFQSFFFTPKPGHMIQFDQYFSIGLKPPTSLCWIVEGDSTVPGYVGSQVVIESSFSARPKKNDQSLSFGNRVPIAWVNQHKANVHKKIWPSLKLRFSHLKMEGWSRWVFFWGNFGLFSGAFAVSFREGISSQPQSYPRLWFQRYLFSPRTLVKWSNLTCAYFLSFTPQKTNILLMEEILHQ